METTSSDGNALQGNESYRSFIDKLAESNVDKYVDLPMIAVMGDTSSGKSSLLSMISLIELPSSDELTTRCPIMLTMNRAQVKSANVSVIWKDKPAGKSSDFEPESINETNWKDLTQSIARAQKHIVDVSGKEVARDVVSVKISSPFCENLTLIDLPGIVRATGKGESDSLAQDIQSLIDDYLKNPLCIILAVHPSNVDFHNSQIMADARKVDPETKRTIPVLTKPDLVDKGAEASVRDLLLGLKTKAFQQGFHMCKGRSQASLTAQESIEAGLANEEVFFRNTHPWKEVEDKNLFGTKNLRVKLSALQMQSIRDSFPDIMKDMKYQRLKAQESYSAIGDVLDTQVKKRVKFMEIKDTFIKMLGPILLGSGQNGSPGKKCSAEFHKQCKVFKDALHTSSFSNISDIRLGDQVIATDSVDRIHTGNVAYLNGSSVYLANIHIAGDVAKQISSDTEGKKEGDVWEKNGKVFKAISTDSCHELYCFERKESRRDPKWIQDMIEEHRPYTLPVFVNDELFKSIVVDFIEGQWSEPSFRLLDEVSATLQDVVKKILDQDQTLDRFPKLRFHLKRKVDDVVEDLTGQAKEKICSFIQSEEIPYTQSHYLFEVIAKMRTKDLADDLARKFQSDFSYDGQSVIDTIQSVIDRNQKKSIDEHMAEEMMHVLDAYGKVAMKRFCDTVPMYCGKDLLHSFSEKINLAIRTLTDDEIDLYLASPPEVETLRVNLKRKLDTLEQGLKALVHLL